MHVAEELRDVSRLSRTMRRFLPYLAPHRREVIVAFAALFASVAFRLLEPWPLKYIFDEVLIKERRGSPIEMLLLAGGATLVFTLFRAGGEYMNKTGFSLIGSRVLNAVRYDVYRHLQQLSLAFHGRARGGDLMMRLMSDISLLRDVIVTAFLPLIASWAVLGGMLIVMLIVDWRLTLASMITLPLFGWLAWSLTHRIRTAASLQRSREGELAAGAAESISAIKVVQALSLEERFAESFRAGTESSMDQDLRVSQLSARLERSVDVLIALSTAIVLVYGGLRAVSGAITPGDLLVFLTYLRRAFNPVQDFAKYTGRLAKASAAADRVLILLEEKRDITDSPTAVDAQQLEGEVAFDNVSFGYSNESLVLDRINFRASPGQRIAIVGASGIGKSTLLSLVLRLYDPLGGKVSIDGRDIREFTLSSLRRQMSVVLQETILFAASIRENIAAGAPGATTEEIVAAAKLANAHSFIERMADGYETLVGERGVTLSGGERQRIAIARAAARNAPILLLDEPTTGLDEENARLVTDALERLARNRTTLIVTHDLTSISQADQILFLENGGVAERGTHDGLLAQRGRYAELYLLQQSRSSKEAESDASRR